MDICLSMWSFALDFQRQKMDIESFADTCQQLNIDTVEVVDHFWISSGRPLSSLTTRGIRVGVYDIASDFVHADPVVRQQQVRNAHAAVDEATRIGAPVVRLLPGWLKGDSSYDDALQMVVESVSSVARYAHSVGATVVLEPHGEVVNCAEVLRYVARQVNSAGFAVGADLTTFLLVGHDPVEQCSSVADLCRLVHLNDVRQVPKDYQDYHYRSTTGAAYAGAPIGDGEIDIRGCIQALISGGFGGTFSVECLCIQDTMQSVQRSVDSVRKILQEVISRE